MNNNFPRVSIQSEDDWSINTYVNHLGGVAGRMRAEKRMEATEEVTPETRLLSAAWPLFLSIPREMDKLQARGVEEERTLTIGHSSEDF